jgi:(E)-4-hydroxy-3-methylbut-2-enyl-diphosphate synthase
MNHFCVTSFSKNEVDVRYCPSPFSYKRQKTRTVHVGNLKIGSEYPIRVQSMTNTDTDDITATVEQIKELADVGCELVRITVPNIKTAENVGEIVNSLRKQNYDIPLAADIHFTPNAALKVAEFVEKIRINPGNFVDKKLFKKFDLTETEYAQELERIEEKFLPLLDVLKKYDRALRIGTNHGSLSDRIMNKYGDTPEGMVASAWEFAKIARKNDFHNFLFSMKASNPQVMVHAYRLLMTKMYEVDDFYPLHLGVTEAGDGIDGRIKSYMGIGSLLEDGLGDTIRVSLTESPLKEIPVAKEIANYYSSKKEENYPSFEDNRSVFSYKKRETAKNPYASSFEIPKIFAWKNDEIQNLEKDKQADFYFSGKNENYYELENSSEKIFILNAKESGKKKFLDTDILTLSDGTIQDYRKFASLFPKNPLLIQSKNANMMEFSVLAGSLLLDGIGNGLILNEDFSTVEGVETAFTILQSTRQRITKTDFISCPSCGRTLFDLEETTAKIKEKTSHLKGLKIGIMGCIVNGPGEMADADFGYVGAGVGKINLYVGQEVVKKNIQSENAVDELIKLIKEHGKWTEPQ